MIDVMRGMRVRLTMAKFMFLHRDKEWLAAVKVVRGFVDERIDATLAQINAIKNGSEQPGTRTDLLWDISQRLPEKEPLRGQIMAVFIPSNDTTSILISNAIYALARYPNVWKKLRQCVIDLGDRPITFETLRSLRYLNYILNESKPAYCHLVTESQLTICTSAPTLSKRYSDGPYGAGGYHAPGRGRS